MRKWIIIAVVVLVIGAAGFYVFGPLRAQQQAAAASNYQTAAAERGGLTATVGATGIVHANQTAALTWQTTGTVDKVNVQVGDTVTAGDVLATIKQTTLPQNVILAQADLVDAQKALDNLLNSQLQSAQAQQAVENAKQALEDAQNSNLVIAKALEAVATAQKAVETADRNYRWSQTQAEQSYIDEAQAQVVLAKDRLDKAQERFKPYEGKPESNVERARLQSELAAAQQQYDAAVRNLNNLQGTASQTDQAIAQANLETAQAQLADAQREYERVKNGTSAADLALLQAQLDDAQREWERLKNGADPSDVDAAQARISAAQAALDQAHLTAPFEGQVTEVNSKPGDQAAPSLSAFRVDDLSRLLVDVQVSEVDINRIKTGQNVSLIFDAIANKEYHGKVYEVALVGTSTQGVVDFTVTVELTDADDIVKPGMTAAVNIVVSQLNDVLLVPNRAVRVLQGERVVYILKNGALTPVNITLGASSDVNSEVLDGDLKVGDLIVLNPPVVFDQNGPPPFVQR